MIHLNPIEIEHLLTNMARDDESQVRTLALQESPERIAFTNENDEPFNGFTVAAIWEAARARMFRCYSCDTRKPISDWSPDSSNVDLCAVCLHEAELENEHSDHGHDEPVADCPTCKSAA